MLFEKDVNFLAKNLNMRVLVLTPASQDAVSGAYFAALSFRKIRDAYGSPSACDCYVCLYILVT
jgi:hypothetical protein